jgi:hypothetical protein
MVTRCNRLRRKNWKEDCDFFYESFPSQLERYAVYPSVVWAALRGAARTTLVSYGANVGVTRCQENGAVFWRGSIVTLRYSNGKCAEPPWTTIRVRFGTGLVTP